MKYAHKVAVVTGASSGIGLATAILLAKRGAKVILAARSVDKLTQIQKDLAGSIVIPTDVAKEVEVKNLINQAKEQLGRIDILINNAGQGYGASIEEINPKTYRYLFDLMVMGPLIAMQQVIPLMRQNGGGSIVNISSGTAMMAIPHIAAYSSLKRALVGLSLTAHEEFKKDKIKVSVVYPYITATNFTEVMFRSEKQPTGSRASDAPKAADTAEFVAEKIGDAIDNGKTEIYVHDWIKSS
jgi:short-subunit dehydrogenase